MKFLVFLFDVFGRVRRRDFLLFLASLGVVYGLLLAVPVTDRHPSGWVQSLVGSDWRFILFVVVHLAAGCVTIKRLHDRDLSGFWALGLLVPVLGWGWLIYELCIREGSDGPNRFGPSPKAGYRVVG